MMKEKIKIYCSIDELRYKKDKSISEKKVGITYIIQNWKTQTEFIYFDKS